LSFHYSKDGAKETGIDAAV